MKEGTRYAGRVKKAFNKMRQSAGEVTAPEPDEPLRRLAVACLAADGSEEQAQQAVDRLLSTMVDWNEIRVSTAAEVQRALGDRIDDGLRRAVELKTVLQGVFDRENKMSLERLKTLGRREARQYLEKLRGVNEYIVASVFLWSLGGHAIPVDNRLLEALRKADLINPTATREEVQAFLERHVSAAQAKEFCLVMRGFSGTSRLDGAAARAAKRKPAMKRSAG